MLFRSLTLTEAGRAALDRADRAYTAWLAGLLTATGEPATVLAALGQLDAALTETRRARKNEDGKV